MFFDKRMDQLSRWFRVERGILMGGCLLLISLGLAIPALVHWCNTGDLNPPQWIFAGTIFTLGLETIFLTFLVGIMNLAGESRRHG